MAIMYLFKKILLVPNKRYHDNAQRTMSDDISSNHHNNGFNAKKKGK